MNKYSNERFVFWRRSPEELTRQNGQFPVISTYPNKLLEAKSIISEGEYETVMILEIKAVVRLKKERAPIEVELWQCNSRAKK